MNTKPTDLPNCPHTPRQSWPFEALPDNAMGLHLGHAYKAVNGASAVADLLREDDLLTSFRDAADDPAGEDAPLSPSVRFGLQSALDCCLQLAVERMEAITNMHRDGKL